MTSHDNTTAAALIETLRGLKPTEGVWVPRRNPNEYSHSIVAGVDAIKPDDDDYLEGVIWNIRLGTFDIEPPDLALILAAPAMRSLILRQADELAAQAFQLYEKDDHIALLQSQLAAMTFDRDNHRAAYRMASDMLDSTGDAE